MANERFKRALAREPQAVPPIWFMRQAGRYHKHYQAIRAKHSFMEMCKDPSLAAEVAMGPIEDFDFDVAILFSDLLFPLEAMGMGLKYEPAPELGWHLREERLKDLRRVDEALPALQFQLEAVKQTRARLPQSKSLIGFVGGPWTLFAYAVEGSHKGGLEEAKKNLRLFKPFCEVLVPLLEKNIELQLAGGAEVVMLFDTAAGELSPALYRDVVAPVLEHLARRFPKRLGYYAKGVQPAHLRHAFFSDPALLAGLGVDHRWEMSDALRTLKVGFVQGNFDQSLLFLSPAEFKLEAERYLSALKKLSIEERAGWVSGLGHGVLPGTPEENVRGLVRLVREVMSC
jgi:uroporphyrinogen decarboxylase